MQLAQAQSNQSDGFLIPEPGMAPTVENVVIPVPGTDEQSAAEGGGVAAGSLEAQPQMSDSSSVSISPDWNVIEIGTLQPMDWIILSAGIVVLAIVFYIVRRALMGSLVAAFADFNKSKNAANTLFLFMFAAGAGCLFATVSGSWLNLTYIVPVGGLVAVLLIVFIMSYLSARASRKS